MVKYPFLHFAFMRNIIFLRHQPQSKIMSLFCFNCIYSFHAVPHIQLSFLLTFSAFTIILKHWRVLSSPDTDSLAGRKINFYFSAQGTAPVGSAFVFVFLDPEIDPLGGLPVKSGSYSNCVSM